MGYGGGGGGSGGTGGSGGSSGSGGAYGSSGSGDGLDYSPFGKISVGAIRFNTDSSKMEYYDGNQWVNITSDSPEAQTGGTRGIIAGGTTPTYLNTIEYINISITGNSLDFGDLTSTNGELSAVSSRTRGVFGSVGGSSVDISYITISSTGNAIDFGGDVTGGKFQGSGFSNQTRGVFIGGANSPGYPNFSDIMDYITIAQGGNAVDFGNLTSGRAGIMAFSSSTRGVGAGGRLNNPTTSSNIIDYVEIATTGNAADFGDLVNAGGLGYAASNSIRGVIAPGYTSGQVNIIEYVTIATLGNAIDFGDRTISADSIGDAGGASPIRGVFAGGRAHPGSSKTDVIDYVNIMSVGNALDFGNLTSARDRAAQCTNGHGGLG